MMRLRELIAAFGPEEVSGDADVTRIAVEPADVQAGSLFLAVQSPDGDGHCWIEEAIARGAAGVVAETPPPPDARVAWVRTKSVNAAAGPLMSVLLGQPSQAMDVLAVTGTNGKGTVCSLLYDILAAEGRQPGFIGTTGVKYGTIERPSGCTTPPPWVLQQTLREMRDAGCTHVALEASSHALSKHPIGWRLDGTRVAVGAFTNLTRDHLDFHGTMEEYARAKGRLFTDFAAQACFHTGDETGRRFAAEFRGPRLTVAIDAAADLTATGVVTGLEGTTATLRGEGRELPLRLRLIGRHNVQNALVAIGMARLVGIGLEDAVHAIAGAAPPPGRLERVPTDVRNVYVDYAHTPDALENILGCLRHLGRGRVICVIGAGGDRDRGKRPLMAQVANSLSDLTIVTSENPRSEDPLRIIADVVAGFPPHARYVAEPDRFTAIYRAITGARPDDIVLIAGQGHETTQNFAGRLIPFSDREVASRILAEIGR